MCGVPAGSAGRRPGCGGSPRRAGRCRPAAGGRAGRRSARTGRRSPSRPSAGLRTRRRPRASAARTASRPARSRSTGPDRRVGESSAAGRPGGRRRRSSTASSSSSNGRPRRTGIGLADQQGTRVSAGDRPAVPEPGGSCRCRARRRRVRPGTGGRRPTARAGAARHRAPPSWDSPRHVRPAQRKRTGGVRHPRRRERRRHDLRPPPVPTPVYQPPLGGFLDQLLLTLTGQDHHHVGIRCHHGLFLPSGLVDTSFVRSGPGHIGSGYLSTHPGGA